MAPLHTLLTTVAVSTGGNQALHCFRFSTAGRLGLSHSFIRNYLSALSAYHKTLDSILLFSHSVFKRFLHGLLLIHLPPKIQRHSWDFPLVLRCLTRRPFEPVAMYDLWLLSFKTLFLVVITSARCVSELAALDFRPQFLSFLAIGLATNHNFLPKVVSAFHLQVDIILPDFFPDPKTDTERL